MSEQGDTGSALDLVLAVVVLALLLAVTWFYVFAMPEYQEQFEDWDVNLPHLTVVLLNTSQWIRMNWLFLALLIMGGGFVVALTRGAARTTLLVIAALVLALLLVAALGGVYLPAQRLSAITTPAPGAGP